MRDQDPGYLLSLEQGCERDSEEWTHVHANGHVDDRQLFDAHKDNHHYVAHVADCNQRSVNVQKLEWVEKAVEDCGSRILDFSNWSETHTTSNRPKKN